MAGFLHGSFKSNDVVSSLTSSYLKQNSSLPIYTGALNASLRLCLYYGFSLILSSSALLICMENTFWNIRTDVNFVDLFKTSFMLYVESGMRKKMEAAIDILRNEQGGSPVIEDFKEWFFKIIIEHYLRKFHCSHLHLTHLIPKYSPPWRSCF